MTWNWQQPDWPNFRWDADRFTEIEKQFLLGGGVLIGSAHHLGQEEGDQFKVELLSAEAVTTSEIEGEILDRESVRSSIRKELGLSTDEQRQRPAERGIAEMMVDLYRTSAEPLSEDTLWRWHRMVMTGDERLHRAGQYRTSTEPMQIISGPLDRPNIHFEAPPSTAVPPEMAKFVSWFNGTSLGQKASLPPVTRAGIAHLYFESIHPFEDGNGRIGRAVAEKALAQGTGHPMLISLAATILARRKQYYEALEQASRDNELTGWLIWFSDTVLEAQRRTTALVEFAIDKAKLFERLRGQLNARQEKALLRMFREGPDGFRGGLSAGKYSTITGASEATATRDLADLVSKKALLREGERRYARYRLNVREQA